ncbi:signal peptidase I [Marinibactrum halimedae]|uniref:Signal peptidase I n=1 Tax=Marinibactrum halimedae TaxID=1444977 RepID=A0AA37T9B7_9GAMM|nr:signal peptidase I [Marinibactrum halimedae]MCD9459182.1 signal peptidase I [Marinibactrum halimedae]GLS27253.1 signal peptidase I [Marinibactrum halimedae]
MDINFPLIMVLLVFASGFIWLFDALFLSGKRRAAVSAVENQFSGVNLPGDELVLLESNDASLAPEQKAYATALVAAKKEPAAVEYAKSFFPVLFVVLVLRSFLVEPFQIPSSSMEPTLEIGDFILVNKFTYGIRLPVVRTKVFDINTPKRGDVMVFFPPHKKQYYIKRVIGLPGDKIQYTNNVLYINGEKQPQSLVASLPAARPMFQLTTETLDGREHTMKKSIQPGPLSVHGVWEVPEGHYFMMGDNRDNSSDSRAWGVVPEENIVGKAFAVWMHWESFFSIPNFSTVGVIE